MVNKLGEKEINRIDSIFGFRGLKNRLNIMEEIDIEKGDTVLDCGSYACDMALYFSKRVGSSGRVYSIEASPNNIAYMRNYKNQENLKNVIIINQALWEEESDVLLYLSKDDNSNSIISTFRKIEKIKKEDGNTYINYNIVHANTIDNIVYDYNIDKVDFVWMNIEGAEVGALKGMKNTVKRNNFDIVISTHKVDDTYNTKNDCMSVLESYGYSIKEIKSHPSWIHGMRK